MEQNTCRTEGCSAALTGRRRFCADCKRKHRTETVRRSNLKRRDLKIQWYQENRERNIAQSRAWAIAHPEERKAMVRKHRETKEFGRVMEREFCAVCRTEKSLTVHHADGNNGKRGRSLNNAPSNLVVLCRSCHAKVHGHWGLKDWRTLLGR